jgi:WD40-like Beta Propeller Repeat
MHGRAVLGGLLVLMGALALFPAGARAAGLMAAYDRYVTGKGFEIGLVNAATGASISLPAGVNTTDDELHPTLTPDGRYLVFMRTKLLPKLNGDIVPPDARTLFVADRQAGTVTSLNQTGAGPVFFSAGGLGWGIRPTLVPGSFGQYDVSRSSSFSGGALTGTPTTRFSSPPSGGLVETVHVDHGALPEFDFGQNRDVDVSARYLSYGVVNSTTGALERQIVQMTTIGFFTNVNSHTSNFGSETAPAGHPVVRSDDYVAFHMGGDVQTVSWPANDLAVAPEPITSASPERDPAWSPDELKLGFIRTSGGTRRLGVFNATPGIQDMVNPLVRLGAEAPTPQTRVYQEVWGGLSLADLPPSNTPQIGCNSTCQAQIQLASSGGTILSPTLTTKSQIGIFIARVTGKRKLLGRTVPRIREVGRVPLGRAKKGRNRFRWNRKVNGKRLRPGTYLLTYRSLRGKRITNTSNSIRIRVNKRGRIVRAKRQR